MLIYPNERDFASISVFVALVLDGGIGDSGVVGIFSVLVFVNALEDNPASKTILRSSGPRNQECCEVISIDKTEGAGYGNIMMAWRRGSKLIAK